MDNTPELHSLEYVYVIYCWENVPYPEGQQTISIHKTLEGALKVLQDYGYREMTTEYDQSMDRRLFETDYDCFSIEKVQVKE